MAARPLAEAEAAARQGMERTKVEVVVGVVVAVVVVVRSSS